jgi:hypothetical protein
MTELIGNGRLLRVCDRCGGVDDAPRHTLTGPAGWADPPRKEIVEAVLENAPKAERARLVQELNDRSAIELHRDCCRTNPGGCPDGDCERLTAGAETLRNGELLDHLIGLQQSGDAR